MPTPTGIFTEEESRTGHLFSYQLARYIGIMFSRADYVIDMGCGNGSYCEYLEHVGFRDVIGVDGTEKLRHFHSKHWKQDLSEPFDLETKGAVLCIEVGEHIPKEFEEVFLDNITNHVKDGSFLVLSWAHEGQQGYGHVNCRPSWWVYEQIEKRGFFTHASHTKNIRSVIEGHVAYLKENLFVFKKI